MAFFSVKLYPMYVENIQIVQNGDGKKSCKEIGSELNAIYNDIRLRYPEIKWAEDYKLGVGVIGSLFPPLISFTIFSDIRKADVVELNSLQRRHNHLDKTERQNGCGFEHFVITVRQVKSILP